MTTEIIVAPPATGKTSKCIQRIQSMRSNHPLSQIWVIVPDRLQAAAFRRRLADSGGSIGTFVGTFGDLYRFVLEREGTYVPVASSPLLHRLVQETVDRSVDQNELKHYAPLQLFPGFILALRESFAELKRSMIYPEQFLDFTQSGTPAQKDLAVLYAHYQSRLQELNWADTEGISWLAVAALDRQPTIASSIKLLIVDGFDSFNGLPENWRNGFDTGHFKLEKLPKVEDNVELIVGLFEKSLPVFLKEFNKKISFIHIDCDLYSSTKTIFDLISNNVQKGTVIVFDEFFNYPGWEFGEALAFFEFIKKNNTKFVYLGYSKNDEQLAIKII